MENIYPPQGRPKIRSDSEQIINSKHEEEMNYEDLQPEMKLQFDQLFSSILVEQQKHQGIKAADSDKEEAQEQLLKQYEQDRGRGFFYKYVSSGNGHGPFTELIDGSRKYDLISAIGVNLLGHSHPLAIKSHLEGALQDVTMSGNLLIHSEAIETANSVVESVKGSKLKHFWFAGSGSFSNDNALKMIWQKTAPKYKVLAFQKAFAGRSIATQEVTHHAGYREGMPQYLDVIHIPHFDQDNPEGSLQNTLDHLEKAWAEHGDELSCMMLELVQGEGGFIFGPKEYYHGVCKWAKDKGIYIFVDEIQTFGRTPSLFAFQHFGLEEYVDIVSVGKALQVCGTLFSEELNPKPGLISGTFNGSITALKMGQKSLRYLQEGNFYGESGRIKQLEKMFIEKLTALKKSKAGKHIGHVGGIGTMICFEVGDKTPADAAKFLKVLFKNGVISFLAGKVPCRVRFLLPLSLTDEHIDEIISVVESSLIETFGE